jgi:hypothetical protein
MLHRLVDVRDRRADAEQQRHEQHAVVGGIIDKEGHGRVHWSEGIEPSFCGVCGEAGGDASALCVGRGKGRTDRQGRARASFCDVTRQPYTLPPQSLQFDCNALSDSERRSRSDLVVIQAVSSFSDAYQQSHEPQPLSKLREW